MKRFAILTTVIALATALGIAVPAKADKVGGGAGACAPPKIFDVATGHCHKDSGAGPFTLGDICAAVAPGVNTLSEPVSVRNTTETVGSCIIDLNGNDLSIQGVMVAGEGNLEFFDDNTSGGLLRIIASTITLDGILDIDLSGELTFSRNIHIEVDTNLTINTDGGANVRNNLVTSVNSGNFTISGGAGVSVKNNGFGSDTNDDFAIGFIGSTGAGEVFAAGNEFFGANVTISANTGDCSAKDNEIDISGSITLAGSC